MAGECRPGDLRPVLRNLSWAYGILKGGGLGFRVGRGFLRGVYNPIIPNSP